MSARDDFLVRRKNGIGGSDIAAIMGLSPWKSQVDVYLDKTNPEVDIQPPSEAALWGIKLEDIIARHYSYETGHKIQRVNSLVVHPKNRIFVANPDRMIVRPGSIVRVSNGGILGATRGLEVKTASAYKARDWGNDLDDDAVPTHYAAQVMWYLGVTGLDHWDIACLIGGQRYICKTIERDDAVIDALFDAAQRFWDNHIVKQIPPEPRTSSDVVNLWPSDNGTMIEANAKTLELLARAQELRAQIAALELELDGDAKRGIGGITGSLKAYIGETAGVELDGRVLATFKKAKDSHSTDWESLFRWLSQSIIAERPDMAPMIDAAVADKTTIRTGSRRLLIKENKQ